MATRRRTCKQCHKSATERRPISRRGLCPVCARQNVIGNNKAMASRGSAGDPEARRKWALGMARAAEAELANVGADE